MIALVFFVIIAGTLLMNARLLGIRIPLLIWFEERFERESVLPGWGSACYAAGTLLLLTFLTDVNEIEAGIFILAIGDGFSTIAGRLGKHRLPHNSGKTWEGTAAFLLSTLPAYFIAGPAAVAAAVASTLAESLPGLEDNLTIPIACAFIFLVL